MSTEDQQNTANRTPGGGAGPKPWGRFVVELGIIFGGVFGAFVAEDIRQNREDDARAAQTYAALLGEVRTFVDRAPLVVDDMESRIELWHSRTAAGERPPPPYYREPRGETPPTAIWEATLASGAVALLDPALFNELAVFYNRLTSVSDRYRRYNEVTEREVLPYLGSEQPRFYDANGRLLGLYRSHLAFLIEIQTEIQQLIGEAETVEALILAKLEP